jgi:2-amino-4-hydroxy-6-hydroxymethyldihydropteridine diphosphokinase
MERDFVIGLGSNLGDRGAYLAHGVQQIASLPHTRIAALSSIYETEPHGPPQPHYLNAALRLSSRLAPEALLDALLAIEHGLGRTRSVRWGARTLDLDVLWSARAFQSERLTIPHARLHERTFALAPLLDVAPELLPSYGEALHKLGGAPTKYGALVFDAASGSCAFVAPGVV